MKLQLWLALWAAIGIALAGCAAADARETEFGEARVESIDIQILESFPVQVNVIARGSLPDPCTAIDEAQTAREGNTFRITLTTRRPAGEVCVQVLAPFEETIPLDVAGLPAGDYLVDVNGVTGTFSLAVDNVLTETPLGETGTAQPGATLEGITFTLDEAIAASVEAERVPASEAPAGAPPWDVHPEHVQFTFADYRLAGPLHEPRLSVFPVSEFETLNALAAGQIQNLRQLLENRPEVVEAELPFLPPFNAAQMFHTHMAYVDFQNGSGVRYLTQYAQDFIPINNHELFYTYQGLTGDGLHYVSAIFPVSHPSLPKDQTGTPPGDFAAYLAGVTRQLDEADASSFTPGLSRLDAMIATLQVASQVEAVTGYDDLIEALRGAGATLEPVGEALPQLPQQFFAVPARLLMVDGSQVHVYEFADATTAEAQAARISPDASEIQPDDGASGPSIVEWIATPHFYRQGRLLVLYLGDEPALLDRLEGVLGPPFASGAT